MNASTRKIRCMNYLFPFLAVLIWSANTVVSKQAAGLIAPTEIAFLRWVLAVAICTPFILPAVWRNRAALRGRAGFGVVIALLFGQIDSRGLFHFIGFMFSSVLLGLAFLSLAVLLSVIARDRTRASGLAIAAWFFFVLVFDLLMLGLLVGTGGRVGGDAFTWLLLLNPADVFRILNVFSLEDVRTLYGLASIVPPALGNPLAMGAVMLVWIALPLMIAKWRFKP